MFVKVRILTRPGTVALLNHEAHSGRSRHSFSFCNASRKEKNPLNLIYLLIEERVLFQNKKEKEERIKRISKDFRN